MSRQVRLAFTDDVMVTFTPRGGFDSAGDEKGFIRVQGRTITGWIGRNAGAFFAEGKNAYLVEALVSAEEQAA